MKKSGLLAASLAAAISATSTNFASNPKFQASIEDVSSMENHESSPMKRSPSTDKFAPRRLAEAD